MKRASYREAIKWIVYNDDIEWLDDEDPIPSVSAALISDMFDVEHEKVVSDLKREIRKSGRQ